MGFIKQTIGNRFYVINNSACDCNSDMILYEINEKVGHKAWDMDRCCEILLDRTIEKASCPLCHAEFKFEECGYVERGLSN